MLYIKKNRAPESFYKQVSEIKNMSDWKSSEQGDIEVARGCFNLLDKQTIRQSLWKEQHGLCAYCMKRINQDEKMRIEHYRSVRNHPEMTLDYKNMLGCCSGGSDVEETRRVLCCDASKDQQDLILDPQKTETIENIRYRKDGRIYFYPEDKEKQNDLDNILMLNGKLDSNGRVIQDTSTQLVKGRMDAYKNFARLIERLDKNAHHDKRKIVSEIKKIIDRIESSDVFPEFAGVTLYYLKRRCRTTN